MKMCSSRYYYVSISEEPLLYCKMYTFIASVKCDMDRRAFKHSYSVYTNTFWIAVL